MNAVGFGVHRLRDKEKFESWPAPRPGKIWVLLGIESGLLTVLLMVEPRIGSLGCGVRRWPKKVRKRVQQPRKLSLAQIGSSGTTQ